MRVCFDEFNTVGLGDCTLVCNQITDNKDRLVVRYIFQIIMSRRDAYRLDPKLFVQLNAGIHSNFE